MSKRKTKLQRQRAKRLSRMASPEKADRSSDTKAFPASLRRSSAKMARQTQGEQQVQPLHRQIDDEEPIQTMMRSAETAEAQRLSVSRVDDPSEREAESVARQVAAGEQAPEVSRTTSADETSRTREDPAQRQIDETPEPVQRQAAENQADTAREADSELARQADENVAAARQANESEIQRQADNSVQRQENADQADRETQNVTVDNPDTHTAAELLQQAGPGRPLDAGVRERMESSFGADFSEVRVHDDEVANQASRALAARAFTRGSDIYFARGESLADTTLLAHELTHVVQQNPQITRSASVDRTSEATEVQRAPAANAPAAEASAPTGFIELQGKPKLQPPKDIADYLANKGNRTAEVNVRFGNLAKGTAKVKRVTKDGDDYKLVKTAAIKLTHPLLEKAEQGESKIAPQLILKPQDKGAISGFVAYGKNRNISKALASHPEILGLPGFKFVDLGKKFTNKLENGQLTLALEDVQLKLGRVFDGNITLKSIDGNSPSFQGNVKVTVKKLAEGKIELSRDTKGLITAKGDVDVDITENFKGKVTVEWDGKSVSGEGTIGYTGEKMSGNVTLRVMELQKAQEAAAAQRPPEEGKKSRKGGNKGRKDDFVLFGEGDLDFAFTEWLSGKAHVIVDHQGYVAIIGQIKPQKEVELFPQTDYVKKLFKVEARAAYGVPVVGNIFVFGNVGMDAFAKVGPGKLYNIAVDGTYTNDPKKANNFSIRGSLNISAAAGLRLRGEAGVGLEVLSHDIKAGAGVNGIAAIRGYAEATPVIGYREKVGETPEDKKGEFFIRGDLEIAAQPFLGLSGDLFVELDSPWWSPAPDKKWTWPLGSLEYPVGGTLGIGASVDYVFGSKQAPRVEFKPVEFDGEKFMTDLYQDKAKPKSGAKGDQPGKWKEKNSKEAAAPPKEGGKGGAPQGKDTAPPPAKSKVKPGGPKKPKKPADPNARTADGKTVKEHQDAALKKDPKARKSPASENTKKESQGVKKKAHVLLTQRLRGQMSKPAVEAAVRDVFVKLKPEGLKRLRLVKRGADYAVMAEASEEKNVFELQVAELKDIHGVTNVPDPNEVSIAMATTVKFQELDPIADDLGLGKRYPGARFGKDGEIILGEPQPIPARLEKSELPWMKGISVRDQLRGRSAGIIVPPPKGSEEITLLSWNTGQPVKWSNVSHAEQQFISWFDARSDDLKGRVRSIVIRINVSPCAKCAGDLARMLKNLKATLNRLDSKPQITAELVFEKVHTGVDPTTDDDLDTMREVGWKVRILNRVDHDPVLEPEST